MTFTLRQKKKKNNIQRLENKSFNENQYLVISLMHLKTKIIFLNTENSTREEFFNLKSVIHIFIKKKKMYCINFSLNFDYYKMLTRNTYRSYNEQPDKSSF